MNKFFSSLVANIQTLEKRLYSFILTPGNLYFINQNGKFRYFWIKRNLSSNKENYIPKSLTKEVVDYYKIIAHFQDDCNPIDTRNGGSYVFLYIEEKLVISNRNGEIEPAVKVIYNNLNKRSFIGWMRLSDFLFSIR